MLLRKRCLSEDPEASAGLPLRSSFLAALYAFMPYLFLGDHSSVRLGDLSFHRQIYLILQYIHKHCSNHRVPWRSLQQCHARRLSASLLLPTSLDLLAL